MTPLDYLLLLSLLTVVIALVAGHRSMGGVWLTFTYAAQLGGLMLMAGLTNQPDVITSSLSFTILGQSLTWRYDALSWYFALITISAGLLSTMYTAGDWGEKFRADGGNLWLLHVAIALNVLSMLILLGSGDLLTLFIGWELVSWASFLLMILAGGPSIQAAIRYITYAMGGAMAILAGLALIYGHTDSFTYPAAANILHSLSTAHLWAPLLLLTLGFGVKMALLPLHLWQAAAYAHTPGPGAAFLGAISSRMGLYALIVVLIQLVGLVRVIELPVLFSFISARDVLAWVAAFTIIFPTFTALRQNDARMLLAWHGIGQGGYMLLGLVMGDALGSAGGLMHVFNHATYQAALFFSVAAVVYRTGTADLNRLGGLVARMPLSFLAMLVGIIGLAGLPPMNGFVSKWLVYRSLMLEGEPLLFVAAVVGTLGTILSVYKLIHNMFLGQLRVEHENIREAPWSMTAPMLILSVVVFVTGLMPGLVLQWIAGIQATVGLPVIDYSLGGLDSAQGSLDMLWVVGVLFAGFGIGAGLFYSGGRTHRVHQLDNYAGGHFLSADIRYHYSDNFYPGLMRLIGPLYRYSFAWLESAVQSGLGLLSLSTQGFYRRVAPANYALVTAVLVLLWVML